MFLNLFSKIKKINAKKRFNQTEIHPPRKHRFFANKPPISEDEGYKPIIYTCGNCDNKIEFQKYNFLNGSQNKITNLNQKDAESFEEIAKIEKLDKIDFLDFYCPKCKMAVRVYYETFFGGDHGDVSYKLKFVLEKKN